jgi:hypothetical protein
MGRQEERGKQMNCYSAEWAKVKGVDVLAIPGLAVVACPVSGRRNSARFDMIDTEKNEYVCQLLKSEVTQWLVTAAHTAELPYNSHCALLDTPLPVRPDSQFHGVVPQIDWGGKQIV